MPEQQDNLDLLYNLDAIESQHKIALGKIHEYVQECTTASETLRKLEFGVLDKKTIQQMQAASDEANKIIQQQVDGVSKLSEAKRKAYDAKLVSEAQKEINQLKKSSAELKKLAADYEKIVKAQEKVAKNEAYKKALKEEKEAAKALAAAQKELERESKRYQAALDKEAKEIEKNSRAYKQLSIAHVKLKQEAQDTGAALGYESKEFEEAAAAANLLGAKLASIDAKLGDHRRNVGNYASSWNGLNNAVSQLAREAPAFANSFGTGIMAISNNLPILQDEIKKTRLENERLIASGKSAVPVWKQVGAALLSWQTLMIAGVTLLAAYGNDIWKWLTNNTRAAKDAILANIGLKDSIDKLSDSYKYLNSELERTERRQLAQARAAGKGAAEAAAIEQRSLQTRINATNDYIDKLIEEQAFFEQTLQIQMAGSLYKEKDVKATQEQINRITKEISDAKNQREELNTELEIAKTNSPQSGTLAFLKQELADIDAKIEVTKVGSAEMNELLKQRAVLQKQLDGINRTGKGKSDPDDGKKKRELEEWRRLQVRQAKEQFEAQKKELEQAIEANKAIAEDDNASYNTRIAALTEYQQLKERLIIQSYEFEKMKADITANEIIAIDTQKYAEILALTQEVLDIETKASQSSLERERQEQEFRIQNMKDMAAYAKQQNDYILKYEEAVTKKRLEFINAVTAGAQQAAQIYANLQNKNTDARLRSLEVERKDISDTEERERQRAERTITDKALLEEKITQIESKAADDRKKVADKTRQDEIRDANRNKALAMVNVIANMIVGISKEVASKGVAGLATSAAIGLYISTLTASLGALVVPAYEDGVINKGFDSPAIVGEGVKNGKFIPEYVKMPGKKGFITDKPMFLQNMPKGSDAIPLPNLMDGKSDMMAIANNVMLAAGGNNAKTEELLGEVVDVLKKQPQRTVTIKDGVTHEEVQIGNARHEFLSKAYYS